MYIKNVLTLLTFVAALASSSRIENDNVVHHPEPSAEQVQHYLKDKVPWSVHNTDVQTLKRYCVTGKIGNLSIIENAFLFWDELPEDVKDFAMEIFITRKIYLTFFRWRKFRDETIKMLKLATSKAKWLKLLLKNCDYRYYDVYKLIPTDVFEEVLLEYDFSKPDESNPSWVRDFLRYVGRYLSPENSKILYKKIVNEKRLDDAMEENAKYHYDPYPSELWSQYSKEDIEKYINEKRFPSWILCKALLRNHLYDAQVDARDKCMQRADVRRLLYSQTLVSLGEDLPKYIEDAFVDDRNILYFDDIENSPSLLRAMIEIGKKRGILEDLCGNYHFLHEIILSEKELKCSYGIEPYLNLKNIENYINHVPWKKRIISFLQSCNHDLLPEDTKEFLASYNKQKWKKALSKAIKSKDRNLD